MSVVFIFCGSVGTFFSLLLLTVSVVRIARLFKRKHNEFVAKRNPTLTATSLTPLILLFTVLTPVLFFIGVDKHPISDIVYILAIFCFYLYITTFLSRTWLIYFTIRSVNIENQLTWIQFIQESQEFTQQNWYLRHKHTWGNGAFLAKLAVLVAIAFVSVDTISDLFQIRQLNWVPELVIVVMWLSFLIFASCRTAKFDDVWGIREEYRFILKCLIASMSGCVIFFLALVFPMPRWVALFVYWMWNLVLSLLVVLQMTRWEYDPNGSVSEQCIALCQGGKQKILELKDRMSALSPRRNQNLYDKLVDTLQDEHEFFKFAEHLVREFNQENILFVVETTQFKGFILGHQDDDSHHTPHGALSRLSTMKDLVDLNTPFSDLVELAGCDFSELGFSPRKRASSSFIGTTRPESHEMMPLSSIVYDEKASLPQKALQIYKKYIPEGALLEINLSHEFRKRLAVIFEVLDDDDDVFAGKKHRMKTPRIFGMKPDSIAHVFDEAMQEVIKVLASSHARFELRDSPSGPSGSN